MKLQWDAERGTFDLALTARGGLDSGIGNGGHLEAAVWVSLFSDGLADPGDMTPDLGEDRRGWYADAGLPDDRKLARSLIWLHMREKKREKVRLLIENEARTSLQWMVEDGVAAQVEVAAIFPRAPSDAVALGVALTEPNGVRRDWKVDLLWGGR